MDKKRSVLDVGAREAGGGGAPVGRKGAIPLNALSPAKSTPSKKHPRSARARRSPERESRCVSEARDEPGRAPRGSDPRSRHSVYCHSRASSFLLLCPATKHPRYPLAASRRSRIILVEFMGLDKVHNRRSPTSLPSRFPVDASRAA